jgi:hypothetical protein
MENQNGEAARALHRDGGAHTALIVDVGVENHEVWSGRLIVPAAMGWGQSEKPK